jgi:N-acyl-D-amino-acid deacylase
MTRLTPLLLAALVLSIAGSISAHAAAPATQPFDLLIRHGKVIDGAGNAWFYGDVGIAGGEVVAVGDLHDASAKRQIDAQYKLVVAPGFIDVHTHADTDLYKQPRAENFIRDGVTTIVTGNCGYGVKDVGEYLARLKRDGCALNVATLYGHNTALRAVKGDRAGDLTDEQLEQAKQLVAKAMRDGAVGFSTGLIYTPGTYSKTEEIIELQKVAASFGGIYATHMRSEGVTILAAIDEALRVGREANCRVEISHFKLPADVSSRMREANEHASFGSDVTLKRVLDARAAGQEVWMDQYPYTASSTTISTMLPDWLLEKGNATAKELLKDDAQLAKVLADMKQQHEVERRRRTLAYAVIASCEAYPQFVGKNVEEAARWRKLHPTTGATTRPELLSDAADASADATPVTMDEQYRTVIDIFLHGGASCVFHSMAEPDVENILRCPLIAVASDSGVRTLNAGMPHPRGYGTNARVLGLYVRERHAITLEDAVRKMTSLPATAFRFRNRGQLREGFRADVTVFDPDRVTDAATFEKPHAYSEGIEYVIVNGQVVLEPGGKFTAALPGQPIYGPGKD